MNYGVGAAREAVQAAAQAGANAPAVAPKHPAIQTAKKAKPASTPGIFDAIVSKKIGRAKALILFPIDGIRDEYFPEVDTGFCARES